METRTTYAEASSQYLSQSYCPYCLSTCIATDHYNNWHRTNEYRVKLCCDDCDRTWEEAYHLTGIWFDAD